MRSNNLRSLLLAASLTSSVSASQQPFFPVQTAQAKVVRRQECIANFYSCADKGATFNGVCCQNGQKCSLDANNNPACCPVNAVCTGTAPDFVAPTPIVAFVPNPYFSFPFIATSFAGPGACSQAASQCNANYNACTAQLEGQGVVAGGSYQVTIAIGGAGGTTIVGNGGVTFPTASATSICSSLSNVACRNLQPNICTMAGTSSAGFYIGTGGANANAARPTLACMAIAACVAGLGLV